MKGALLVAGTSSDAGKSVLVAGLCRWLARQGVRVAPFKAQNMALNSAVTADGAEIGRAQAMQAAAAGVEPEAAMNPVLLKPGSETRSQVILLGRPVAEAGALDYQELKPALEAAVAASLADLRRRFDVVVCEGAGSPAEINLRHRDIANMGLARAAGLPVLVVGDIDRGGLLAALYGTLAVLEPADQRHIAGFVVNKFRGDLRLLAPGLDMLRSLTGRPTLGVLPWREDLWLDAEDSLDLDSRPRAALPPHGAASLRVAVVRLPRMSNVTDVDPLAAEPGVIVDLATTQAQLDGADLVILPGTRATVSDLGWLRESGLAAAIAGRAARGLPVLGICGGYQMLARSIRDDVESHTGTVPGLGLLPATVTFRAAKTLTRTTGKALGEPVAGYEIHHGAVTPDGGDPFPGGCAAGSVRGTTWHGIFENDAFRRAFLRDLAARAGRDFTPAPDVSFAAVRERRYDVLAGMIEEHLDAGALAALIEGGVPAGLPAVVSGLAPMPLGQQERRGRPTASTRRNRVVMYSAVMPDIKPPRLAGSEADTLRALLQYQRESLARKVAGLDEAAARRSPVGSGTSLLWLVKHMARAEVTWILHRFAGLDVVIPGDQPEPGDTVGGVTAAYREGWQQADAVAFGGAGLDELCRRQEAGPPVSLRWVLMHLLEETARHAGHADILRELVDGHTGR